jgi:hypothetical protein
LSRFITPLPGVFDQTFFEKVCDQAFFEKVCDQAFFEKVCVQAFFKKAWGTGPKTTNMEELL